MTSKDYVQELDWSSAIAAATHDIENKKNVAVSYRYRGIARCFIPDKEGKHKEAIEDLSRAIILKKKNNTIYYYRAYAYYLDGNYERAIRDCDCISIGKPCLYRDELLGKIYFAMGKYEDAVKKSAAALYYCLKQNPQIPNPGLLENYQEACKRMNSV
jgi:tetratricopeptide (TPR) repeat protein